jgi:hypothetical protein
MSNQQFEINTDALMSLFKEFDWKKRKDFFRRLFRTVLQPMKKQAITNLGKAVEPDKINFKDKYGKTLSSGIKITPYRKVKGARIDILGNYKLKWFQLGTSDRYQQYNTRSPKKLLKKERYTGRIKPSHFFTDARDATQQQVLDNLTNNIAKMIQTINKKNHNKK